MMHVDKQMTIYTTDTPSNFGKLMSFSCTVDRSMKMLMTCSLYTCLQTSLSKAHICDSVMITAVLEKVPS